MIAASRCPRRGLRHAAAVDSGQRMSGKPSRAHFLSSTMKGYALVSASGLYSNETSCFFAQGRTISRAIGNRRQQRDLSALVTAPERF